jgi:O-antigen/teichoic acid export membrane protein
MFNDIVKGIARNTSIILFQQVITTASSILLMLFLPRYLGAVEYGRLFLATSIIGIFEVVVNYGGSYFIAKEVSRDREATAQLLVDSLALRVCLALVSICGVALFSLIAGYNEGTTLILLVSSVGLFSWASTTTLYACYQGHELLRYTSYGAVASRLFINVFGIMAVLLGGNALVIVLLIVCAGFLNSAVLWSFSKKIISSIPRIQWKEALRQLRTGGPYFLFIVFGTIYFRIDTVMLSKMVPEEIVGSYGAAYRFFESLNLPYFLTLAVYPVLSRLWKEQADMHRKTMQKSLEYTIIFGILLTVGTIAFAKEIVSLFYGLEEYSSSVILLQCLAGGMIFLHIDMILGTTLLASDKQKQLMVVSLMTIPVNIGLNLVMIPYTQAHYANGGIGAAIATGITEMFVLTSAIRILPKGVLDRFRYPVIPKSIASGIVMGLFIWIGTVFAVSWVVLGVLGTALYVGLLFLLKTLEEVEEQFFKGYLFLTMPTKIRSLLKLNHRT